MTPEHHAIVGCLRQERLLADELFSTVPPRVRRALDAITSSLRAEADKLVINQGDRCRILVLKDGTAESIVFNRLNEQKLNGRIMKNEIMGLPESIRNSYSTISVRTISRCRFDVIDRNGLLSLLSNEPEICYRMVERFSFDLSEAYRSMYRVLRAEELPVSATYLDDGRYVM